HLLDLVLLVVEDIVFVIVAKSFTNLSTGLLVDVAALVFYTTGGRQDATDHIARLVIAIDRHEWFSFTSGFTYSWRSPFRMNLRIMITFLIYLGDMPKDTLW